MVDVESQRRSAKIERCASLRASAHLLADLQPAAQREHGEDEEQQEGGRHAGRAEPAVPETTADKSNKKQDDE